MVKTIRARLTLWYIVLLALILVGLSGALYVTLARGLYQQVDDYLARHAHDLGEGLRVKNGQVAYPGGENDITDQDAPYIFDRFYRSANGRASGAGLGLAIARAFVQAQGGTISVASALGTGTTFTVELPMRNF